MSGPFGRREQLADGLTIEVDDRGAFQPSSTASKADAESYRRFRVEIVNGTESGIDLASTYVTATSGDVSLTPVIDAGNDVGITPASTLAPGKSARWTVGYGLTSDRYAVSIAVGDRPGDSATFTSRGT